MSDALFDVSGQVVLLSGGSRGIGKAIAAGFAERGARVVVTGREAASLEDCARELSGGGAEVGFEVCDVAEAGQIQACVGKVLDSHGRIDCLVNCAGVNRRIPAEDYTAEDFDFVLDINLKGAFQMSQAVGRHMLEQGHGTQINIDSFSTYAPLTNVTPYSMSKSGMSAMTRGLAQEWGPKGVRVNAIAPGFILTDLTERLWSDQNMRNWSNMVTPLRRLGVPRDMVGTAIFLASDAAAFVTGQVIRVDGGTSAGTNWPITGAFKVTEG